MHRIERHEFKVEQFWTESHLKRQLRRTNAAISSKLEHADNHMLFADYAHRAACNSYYLNHYSPVLISHLEYAAELATASFQFVISDGDPVTVTVAGKTWEYPYQLIRHGAADWMKTFDLAMVSWRNDLLDILVQVPEQKLRDADGYDVEPIVYANVAARKALHAGDAPLVGKILLEVLSQPDDPNRDRDVDEWVNLLSLPESQLLFGCVDDSEQWNRALIAALEGHKRYYSSKGFVERDKDETALICLPALACGVHAYDRNLEFQVESDYLPMHLIEGAVLVPRAIAEGDVDRLEGLLDSDGENWAPYLNELYFSYEEVGPKHVLVRGLSRLQNPAVRPAVRDALTEPRGDNFSALRATVLCNLQGSHAKWGSYQENNAAAEAEVNRVLTQWDEG